MNISRPVGFNSEHLCVVDQGVAERPRTRVVCRMVSSFMPGYDSSNGFSLGPSWRYPALSLQLFMVSPGCRF